MIRRVSQRDVVPSVCDLEHTVEAAALWLTLNVRGQYQKAGYSAGSTQAVRCNKTSC